ncbi:hypothetical protein GCK72_009891 [Caenorhabditis remanei]|uniref:Palmitoyltransferase n=1 Tax=Caenorhabditis remanei TaxID=31234 RepID=A0A6A5H3S2_CAERE|nr:hypothetical protein GCK72_009891 [Caenorhabditis remanei]KAF1761635.1 hypothetical protein GCK72_009891 [Caenorhabditis remanei]
MWIERTKWMLANIGWPIAFTFWYQIMVVLYAANGEITQLALYYFQFLWIIIVCSYFSASFTPPSKCQIEDDKNSTANFCELCNYSKPPRWHHCRRCNQCVHRMDHHCPILQMIRSVYTGEILSTTDQLRGTGVSNALMVGFAAIYLLKNQLPNLFRNQTLIEESRETTIYDLGSWQENVKSLMGPWRIAWLPVPIDERNEKKQK